MKNKTIALVVAVLAIGLFVMPSVLSLFAGQHTFVDYEATNCVKCHKAEGEELAASTYHHNIGGTLPSVWGNTANDACKACHDKANTIPGEEGHAAVTLPCVYCHPTVVGELNKTYEAHTEFAEAAINGTLHEGANEACIACHTHTGVNITWIRATHLAFTWDNVDDTIVGNFTAEGRKETTVITP